MLTAGDYEALAVTAEASGFSEYAATLREKALTAPAAIAPPEPAIRPAPPGPAAPPPGPRADRSPYLGMTQEQVIEARAEPSHSAQPPPPPPSVSFGVEEEGAPPPAAVQGPFPQIGAPPEPDIPQAGAGRVYVVPKVTDYDAAPPVTGRDRDVSRDTLRLNDVLRDTQRKLVLHYMSPAGGYRTHDTATRMANARVSKIRRQRINPEGDPTTSGEGTVGSFIPTFRESRILQVAVPAPELPSQTKYIDVYRDPETGEYTDPETGEYNIPTPGQYAVEALARQRVLDPEDAERIGAVRFQELRAAMRDSGAMVLTPGAEEELREEIVSELEPAVSGALTAVDPETGAVLETAVGAAFRSFPAIVSTAVNTAFFNYMPVFWEQDPDTGKPVDPDDPAYKMHAWAKKSLVEAGSTEGGAELLLSGSFKTPVGMRLPIPFQPIQRSQPHVLDPQGRRVASASGNFLVDTARNLAVGRSAGDEAMSIKGVPQEMASEFATLNPEQDMVSTDPSFMASATHTYPYWIGIATEMVYGIGPLAALGKAGRLAGSATTRAAQATGRAGRAATGAARRAQATAEGVEAAATAAGAPKAAAAAGLASGAARGAAVVGEGVQAAARGVEKGVVVASRPREAAKRVLNIRAAQDLADGHVGLDDMDILLDRHNVRRVVGEKIGEEVLTPWVILGKVRTGVPVARGDLWGLAGSSKSARLVLERAGISPASPAVALSADEVGRVIAAAEDWAASAYLPSLRAAASGSEGEAAKATRAMGLLDGVGSTSPAWRVREELADIAAGNPGRVADVVEDFAKQVGEGALPIRPTSPVVRTLHDLGRQVADAALSPKPSPLRAPFARGVSRRLGDKLLDQDALIHSPHEVLAAVRGAGGRAVEATLENVVPDDMVFVTKSVMMPRASITREVLDDVRGYIGGRMAHTPTPGPKVDGKATELWTFDNPGEAADALIQAAGSSVIKRSSLLSKALTDIAAGNPVSAEVFDTVLDLTMGDAFRRASTDASDALFAGRQMDAAMVEGVNKGLDWRPETRVPRRGVKQFLMQDMPMVGKAITPVALARQLRKVGNRLNKQIRLTTKTEFPPQTPAPLARAMQRLAEIEGTVADNLIQEVRKSALEVKRAGGTPEEAFNIVVSRRVSRDIDDAVAAVENEVARLVEERGMDEVEAFFHVGYKARGGKSAQGLGQGSRAGVTAEIRREVRERARVEVLQETWAGLLEQFFGKQVYDTAVKSKAKAAILRPGTKHTPASAAVSGNYRAPTLENVREVLAELRRQNTRLERGLSRGGKDALVDLLASYAAGRDRAIEVLRMVRTLRDEHPELFVDLVPTSASGQPVRMELEAGMVARGRSNFVSTVRELADEAQGSASTAPQMRSSAGYADLVAVRVDPATGTPVVGGHGAYRMANGGRYANELDQMSLNMMKGINAADRQALVDAVWSAMIREGTTALNPTAIVEGLNSPTLNLAVFEKRATIEAVKKVLRGLELNVARWNADHTVHLDRRTWQGTEREYNEALLHAFEGSRADRALYLEVERARDLGVLDEDIVGAVTKKLVDETYNTLAAPILDEIVANARAMGFSPENVNKAQDNLVDMAANLDPANPGYLLYGQEFATAVGKLKSAAKTGKLAENIESLRRRDALKTALQGGTAAERGDAAVRLAWEATFGALGTSRTVAASGLLAMGWYLRPLGVAGQDEDRLGGVPVMLPVPVVNWRYVGMNLLTAPLIALTTVGGMRALKMGYGSGAARQTLDVAQQATTIVGPRAADALSGILPRPLVDAVSPRPAGTVVFTSKTGQDWTYQALTDAMARNNIQITRGSVEFGESFTRELARDAGLLADGSPAGPLRKFLRNFDPTMTNLPQYVANATDRAFRMNTFASALKDGLPEAQAAQLARAVVLDYGRVPKVIKGTLNKYMLFIAFRAAMYTETIEALARDGGTFSRVLLAQRNSQQATDQWLLGPDYAKTRLVLDPKEYVFDQTAGASLYGPVMPQLDAVKDFMQFAAFVVQTGAEGNDAAGRLTKGLAEEQLIPALSFIAERAVDAGRKPTDPGFKVSDVWVSWAVANGPDTFWPWMKQRYNIVPVTDKERRSPGRPTAMGSEWRFDTAADMAAFKRDLVLFTYMGAERAIADYTKLGMTYDVSDYLDPKRRGLPFWFSFGIGAQTPIGSTSAEELVSRALFEQTRAAQSAQPRE